MCRTRAFRYTCGHFTAHTLSSCQGTYTTSTVDAPLCSESPLFVIRSTQKCRYCQYKSFCNGWESRIRAASCRNARPSLQKTVSHVTELDVNEIERTSSDDDDDDDDHDVSFKDRGTRSSAEPRISVCEVAISSCQSEDYDLYDLIEDVKPSVTSYIPEINDEVSILAAQYQAEKRAQWASFVDGSAYIPRIDQAKVEARIKDPSRLRFVINASDIPDPLVRRTRSDFEDSFAALLRVPSVDESSSSDADSDESFDQLSPLTPPLISTPATTVPLLPSLASNDWSAWHFHMPSKEESDDIADMLPSYSCF